MRSVPGGVDLPELVEAEPLRLLHARRQGAQEVLGRHENLRQRERRRVQIFSSLNCLLGPLGAMRLSLHFCRLREEELCPGTYTFSRPIPDKGCIRLCLVNLLVESAPVLPQILQPPI